MELITAKTLVNDLADAENSAKSFGLTRDTNYLDQFYRAAERTDQKLIELHEILGSKNNLVFNADSLDTLISKKFEVLDELLIIQDQFRVQQALDKVVNKIEHVAHPVKNTKTVTKDSTQKKKGILSWLFKKRRAKKDTAQVIPVAVDPNEQVTLVDINQQVEKVKKEEHSIEVALKERELELLVEDKVVTDQIKSMIRKLEENEMASIEAEASQAEKAMESVNGQIAVFCIITGLLLVFMSASIINYVRNNNRYRKVLRAAKKEAEELAHAKEKFLANMSHEIRTPMNAIAGFTEQIAEGPLNEEQREQISMVRKSAEHLLYIINDVLDFTKLQAGKLKLEDIGFLPAEVTQDVVTFIQPLAEEKKITFSNVVSDQVPEILIGDPFRLRQILLNLLSNAIKFTDTGSISVNTTTVMQNNDRTRLRITVSDTGLGMNEKQLKKVFREFEQAEVSTSRNFGGTGLGLSIVNMLVKLHSGDIELKSKPGVGTSVTIEIPYTIGTEGDLTEAGSTQDVLPELPENIRVLVVDDEPYNRKLLTTILGKQNAVFTEAGNGKEALEELQKNTYDLVLMDARMPEMNGIEASQEIRSSNTSNKDITIIALTAAVNEADKKVYRKAGMDGFIAKPFKEQELLQEINRVIKSPIQTQTNSMEHKVDNQKEAELDFSELLKVGSKDMGFYKDMLQTLIDGTGQAITDINSDLLNKDWDRMADHAHKACSPCLHISANELYDSLKEIETRSRNKTDLDSMKNLVERMEVEAKKVVATVQSELQRHT